MRCDAKSTTETTKTTETNTTETKTTKTNTIETNTTKTKTTEKPKELESSYFCGAGYRYAAMPYCREGKSTISFLGNFTNLDIYWIIYWVGNQYS